MGRELFVQNYLTSPAHPMLAVHYIKSNPSAVIILITNDTKWYIFF